MESCATLVGVANTDVAGLKCPVVARSCGESTRAWWSKMGLWVGLAVPDMVGVVNVVLFGSDVTPEGGGSAGTVVLAGGCDTLVLCIMSLVVGVGALWGASSVVRGPTTLRVVCASPCASPLMSLLIRYAHIPLYFRFSFTFPTSPIHHYAPPLRCDHTRSRSLSHNNRTRFIGPISLI